MEVQHPTSADRNKTFSKKQCQALRNKVLQYVCTNNNIALEQKSCTPKTPPK